MCHSTCTLQGRHQTRSLYGVCRAVTQLSLVVIAPRVHLPSICTCHAVQGTTRNVNHLLALQGRDPAWSPHVVVSAMTQAVVISLTPARIS